MRFTEGDTTSMVSGQMHIYLMWLVSVVSQCGLVSQMYRMWLADTTSTVSGQMHTFLVWFGYCGQSGWFGQSNVQVLVG